MKLLIYIDPGYYLIELEGDLDASSSLLLDSAIQEAIALQPKWLLINLEQLYYISSEGICVFLTHVVALKEAGIQLIIYGLSPIIQNIFDLVDLSTFIKMVESKEEAYSLFSAPVVIETD